LVGKCEEGRLGFLRGVVENYQRFREGLEEGWMQPQRLFLAYCAGCGYTTQHMGLPSQEEVSECHRCHVKTFSESG
jgi:uncharacterized paraquat-inducible protein A